MSVTVYGCLLLRWRRWDRFRSQFVKEWLIAFGDLGLDHPCWLEEDGEIAFVALDTDPPQFDNDLGWGRFEMSDEVYASREQLYAKAIRERDRQAKIDELEAKEKEERERRAAKHYRPSVFKPKPPPRQTYTPLRQVPFDFE